MKTSLKLGLDRVAFEVPEALFAGHHDVSSLAGTSPDAGGSPGCTERALEELRTAGLPEAVRDRRVALLLADGSRKPPGEAVWGALIDALAPAARVVIFVCTGTHEGDTPENLALAERLRKLVAERRPDARLVMHDARAEEFADLGSTSSGTRLEFHPELVTAEAFLVLSDFKPHYFAGYSNPLKYYLPGLTSLEAVRGNHSWALDPRSAAGRHPWHPDPERRDNPLAADMLEGFERVVGDKPHFAMATVTGGDGLLWAGGGETAEVSARAMLAADRLTTLEVEATRYLVVSNGGNPYDESLYAAQRALELTRGALAAGGEVLWLAECTNGIGPGASRENFFEPLTRPLDEVLRTKREEYVLYSHKAWKFADYLQGAGAVHLASKLPDDEVRRIHMRPAPAPQAVIDRWAGEAGPGDAIRFIDDASRLFVSGLPPEPIRTRSRSR